MGVVNGLSTEDRKSIFLVALKELEGNVTKACEVSNISRQSYYKWLEKDEEFAVAVKMVQLHVTESMLDEAEDVIRFALKRSDREVAKWVLARLGKGRGYGQKVELEHSAGQGFRGLEFPDTPESADEWQKRADGE